MKTKKIIALFLMLTMVVGIMPTTVFAYSEDYFYDEETSIDVSTDGKVYSIYTEDYLDEKNGMTFLYVVKRNGRYYTPGNPRYTEFKEVDSVYAVDITEYYDAQTNTFSGISNNVNVGVMQYQQNYGSYMYLDGDMLFALSIPFESKGETWFDGGIRYYPSDQTYSYSRPLWQANGDGTGYLYDSYIDWYSDSDVLVYGVLDLKFDGVNYRFALRDKSAEYNEAKAADPDNYNISVDVTAYLYAAPCGHEQNVHSEAVAPTCMDKGCEEYWYCRLCNGYFADSKFSEEIGHIPVLPALDHTYGPEGCINCGRSTPVYTKVTSYDQFRTLDPNASFIAVAEIDNGNGGKDYYVLKKEIGTSMADIDEDGNPDILQIDENSNGVADVLEIDANGDGIPDAMDFDGFYDGELDGVLDNDEIWEYLFYLEREYTDGYIPGIHVLSAIPVTPAADGSISVLGLDALEWIMERKISNEELYDQYYGDGATVKDYENDFTFRIPNFWIRSVVTIDNNFYQQPYDQGDSKWWGVLFGKDGKELNSYFYEPIYGEDYPDDAVILYTEAFYSLNGDGELEYALRFLVNGEEKNFIMTSYSFWEEIEGTQYPIYLYCSDAGQPVHEHVWSNWTIVNDDIHKRVCTVEGCTVFDLASHNKDESKGCRQDTENYQLGHWVTCADCEGDYHEYHTRETTGGRYGKDYWRDAEDGINHVIYCTECNGPAEYQEHTWTNWWIQIDVNGNRQHMRRCKTYACYRYEYREADDHIYTTTVTTEPTCTEPGMITYTCIADDCNHSHTEEIPATGHDWGEWTPNENDATKEIRICKNDPTHTEERLAHEHEWSEWKNDEFSETHFRTCGAENCPVEKETAPHNFDEGVVTTEPTQTSKGIKTYTCTDDCGYSYTIEIPAISEPEVKEGFEEEDGKLYYYEKGKRISGWFEVEGVKYYASSATNVVINYNKKIQGKYYVWNDETGLEIADGFVTDENGTKCYEDGINVIGWRHADGSGPKVVNGISEQYSSNPEGLYYFLSTTGYMVTDATYKLGGYNREFNEDHTVKPMNGLQTNAGELYYYVDGVKQTGWQTIEGVTYYFRASDAVYGRAATKWMYIGNKVYYFYASTSATPYALKDEGKIGGIEYTYDEDGYILYNGFVNCDFANAANSNTAANIQKTNGTTRYYKNGEMQTGWQQIDGNWYYFYAIGSSMGSGYMCTESRKIGGVYYEFNENGICMNK